MRILSLLLLCFWFVACCEPGHRDSQPFIVIDSFQESYGKDLDVFTAHYYNLQRADSAYYPIYSFAIKNTGTQDDDYTLRLRKTLLDGTIGGFDIRKHVAAGATVVFRTPTPEGDSSATYYFPHLVNPNDQRPNIDEAYYGIQSPTPDSTKIHLIRPSLSISYGEINNGPEACNTPASFQTLDINEFPRR
jgi:hypothetical protein